VPLCVDLDGTLVKTDTLVELALKCATAHPETLWRWPGWLLRGKAHFKRRLSELATLDPACLPYNSAVVGYVEAQWQAGRTVALVTGADRLLADRVAAHLGCFDQVIASDGRTNRIGASKLNAIHESIGARFAYVGDAPVDEPIWQHAAASVLVNASARRTASLTRRIPFDLVLGVPERPWRGLVRALRPHQWTKNLLVFLPLISSHQVLNLTRLAESVVAFVAFSLLASSCYILNDLLDLEADRRHQDKRLRPFAAGTVSPLAGMAAMPLLAGAALALGFVLSPAVGLLLLGYMALTIAYSVRLKRCMMLDVVALSGCYALRVIIGGAAAQIEVSNWLLAFTTFFFFSLALLKRFVEVRGSSGSQVSKARGYVVEDGPALGVMGAASAYLATLVLVLYLSSDNVVALYSAPQLLWLLCPLMLYWVSRLWLLAYRGQVHGDPVLFAIRDRASYVVGLLTAALLVGAAWLTRF
jgi:4-hydroxybenzoate polyprenyltransferase